MRKFLIILLFPITIFSQTSIITGSIKNDLGEAVYGATIVIHQAVGDDIIAYNISDSKGNFKLKVNSLQKQFNINIRVLGYKKKSKLIKNKNQKIDFVLTTEITELTEILIKTDKKIVRKGDTISYNVASFAVEKDRTIADVISKMPGIEVLSNGKILYLGKPIIKYYIEGLDLLEGRYNLANKNLPFNQVSKVQILENHQPIKILDSLVYSDKVALNIKLKNNVSFTGQATLGLGASPLIWENNITPMLFTKKKQVIATYQNNNTGRNIATQLKTLTIEDLIDDSDNSSVKNDWLSIQQINTPNFSEKRWLNNTIHLVSVNYLQKVKNDLELRLNMSYLNDYQQKNGFTNTSFFTQNDAVKILENKYNRLFNNSFQTNLTLLKNSKKNYLKNSIKYQGNWDSQVGKITTGSTPIYQDLKNHYFTISNKFKNIFDVGNQLITLKSLLSFNKSPQELIIKPGQFQELLNNGNVYNNLEQQIDLKSFYTNNSISLTKGYKQFTISPKIGFQLENQKLRSRTFIDNIFLSKNEFYNELDWFKSKAYFELQTQFKKNDWRFELNTPLSFNHFNNNDNHLEKKETLTKLIFEPRISVINHITSFWKVNASIRARNKFGSINNIHYAYILKNYRNIERMNSVLPQTLSQDYNFGIFYRNPIKSLFGNLFYSYTNTKNNILYDTHILSNGTIEMEAIEKNNVQTNYSLSGKLSKYVSSIKTSITLKSSFSLFNSSQILNNLVTEIKIKNTSFGLKSNTDITNWFDIEYKNNWIFSNSEIQNQNNRSIINQSHLLNLNLYPQKKQYIGLKIEFFKNDLFVNKNNYFFADLVYRYTYKEKNIDVEIQYYNIFNTRSYKTLRIDSYRYIETNFNLRPSQILFKIRFSL